MSETHEARGEDHSREDPTREDAHRKNIYISRRKAEFLYPFLAAVALIAFAIGSSLLSYHKTEPGIEFLCVGFIATALGLYVLYRHIYSLKRIVYRWPYTTASVLAVVLIGRGLYVLIYTAAPPIAPVPEFMKRAIWQEWDRRKGRMAFTHTSDAGIPGDPPLEARFWFKNTGEIDAREVTTIELRLFVFPNAQSCYFPDTTLCYEISGPKQGGPSKIGPGLPWNFRAQFPVVPAAAQVRATVQWITGPDPDGNDETINEPFCQEMTYDPMGKRFSWTSCLGSPRPKCTPARLMWFPTPGVFMLFPPTGSQQTTTPAAAGPPEPG